jgi:hypothetical protein
MKNYTVEDYQKAFKNISKSRASYNFDDWETIKELVEHTTPKKVIPLKYGSKTMLCPICLTYYKVKRKYCHHCGQRLDWRKT